MSGGGGATGSGRNPVRWRTTAAVVCATAVAVAGCSSGASTTAASPEPGPPVPATAPPPVPSTAAGGDTASAPDPNAPEVNAAGDIPDNQVFVPFTTPDGAVVVKVPQGWARSSDGPATVFTDKFNSVQVEVAPRSAAADVASSRAEDVPQLQASVPGLAARSLYRFFRAGEEETVALQGVSLEVGAGELVAVVGPSGSGKSTLLACLAGLDEPDGGRVWVEGRRMSHRPEPVRARLRAERIGYLGQSANLFAHLTVEENLLLVRRLAGRAAGSSIGERLEAVGLAGRARAYLGELSGGEAARAGLAVALAADPAVVLADEPT